MVRKRMPTYMGDNSKFGWFLLLIWRKTKKIMGKKIRNRDNSTVVYIKLNSSNITNLQYDKATSRNTKLPLGIQI